MHTQSSIIHHPSSPTRSPAAQRPSGPRAGRTGAVLTLVIVALALTGVVMFVLTEGANAMLFRADTAYLQALERNLISSGLALARQKVAGGLPADESLDPDVAAFAPEARLRVRVLEVRNDRARVHIETSCRKGRHTFDTSREYTLILREPPSHPRHE